MLVLTIAPLSNASEHGVTSNSASWLLTGTPFEGEARGDSHIEHDLMRSFFFVVLFSLKEYKDSTQIPLD